MKHLATLLVTVVAAAAGCATVPHPQGQPVRPYATGGVYVNHIGREDEDGEDQVRAAYGTNYQRLATLKMQYDPTNLFRHNQNIKPTG